MRLQTEFNQWIVAANLMLSFSVGATEFSSYVDEVGNISYPENFRTDMVHIGSWLAPEGDASGFHDVFTEKQSLLKYKQTGEFPDGATLVKEVRRHARGHFTTGSNIAYSDNIKFWFVMIKDNKTRFKNNKVWAKGWGWALFNADNMNVNAAKAFESDCKGCHLPAKDTDWIFVEGYPILSE